MCKFIIFHVISLIGKKYEECINIPPPSNDDAICKKFFDSMTAQEIKLPGRKDSYSITYWNESEVYN